MDTIKALRLYAIEDYRPTIYRSDTLYYASIVGA